jgi:hypothetical protein
MDVGTTAEMLELNDYPTGDTMAKVEFHGPIKSFSGSLEKEDKFTFRRTRKGKGGKTIIIKKADMSKVEWSPAQKQTRGHFSEAVAFAQSVLADPELKQAYQKRAKRKGTDAYHLAISEYNKVPRKQKAAGSPG